ncbi:MAG TPA: sugar ABC transporter substrate-binding protein [Chloroflexota bacterium]|nr:sugar ABC transporter substrate-binding protein [Chloroflexota bacterium]
MSIWTRRGTSRRALLSGTGALATGAGAVALAACGATGTGSGGTGEIMAPAEIFFMLPGAAGLEQDLYNGFINDFHARQSKIKVRHTFEPVFGDYPAKLRALLAADTWPDIAHQHLSVVQDFSQQGALTELKPYMNRDKISEKDFIPVLVEEFTYRGKLMAIPKDSAAFGVHYNMDMFDKAGIKYPTENWTWDEFVNICQRLTKPDQGQFAITSERPAPNSENWEAVLRSFGGSWYNKELTKSNVDNAGSIDAIQLFHDLEFKHRVTPNAHKFQFTGDAWRGGVTAMAFGHHATTYFHKTEKREFKFDVVPIPKGKGGNFVAVGASGYALPSKAKYKDQGWELLKFLTAKEVQAKIASGHRWGPSRPDSIDNLAWEDNIPAHFKDVHVEPLKGKGKVPAMGFVFPVGQLDILEVYKQEFTDKLWAGTGTARDAAMSAKPKFDAVLARFTK